MQVLAQRSIEGYARKAARMHNAGALKGVWAARLETFVRANVIGAWTLTTVSYRYESRIQDGISIRDATVDLHLSANGDLYVGSRQGTTHETWVWTAYVVTRSQATSLVTSSPTISRHQTQSDLTGAFVCPQWKMDWPSSR